MLCLNQKLSQNQISMNQHLFKVVVRLNKKNLLLNPLLRSNQKPLEVLI
jgi:hypothetical protein